MDMIQRTLVKTIQKNYQPGFINLIYGPRRIGKTVILQQLTEKISKTGLVWLNGDTQEAREALADTSLVRLTNLVKNSQTIIIDEAQRIPNIGLSLKILIDNFPAKTFFVTGSSSLTLSQGLQEALTGRTQKYRLYPLSTQELSQNLADYQKPSLLTDQLIFGAYPYLLQLKTNSQKQQYLTSVVEDYLFKDVFLLKNFSLPDTLKKLAVLLAFQIGSEVSLNELAKSLGVDIKTISRYLFLLEKSFVIFPLGAWSKNLRKEVVKSKKYYFWDLGIRNALIGQFMNLETRTDRGALWENFLISERIKKHQYLPRLVNYYFWRSYDLAEIDWLEQWNQKLQAFEFKWQKSTTHTPKAFLDTYHEKVKLINRNNYLEFIL